MSEGNTGQQPAGGAPAGEQAPAGTPPTGGAEHPATVQAPWSGVEGVYKIGDGENAQPWWAGIQEEPIREYMEAKQYATPEEAARAAWNANKLLKNQENALIAPGEDASPEDWNNFYSKLGRPEKADAYDLKLPEGVQLPEEILNETTPLAKEILFELGATPEKAQAAYEKWVNLERTYEQKAMEAERAANEQALGELTQKWESEEKLNEMRAAGQRAVKALGLSNEKIEAIEAQVGSATIVELLALIGSKAPEGTFKDTGQGTGDPNDPTNMSPTQAQQTIERLQGDDKFQKAYTDKNHPEHASALKRMEALFIKANSSS